MRAAATEDVELPGAICAGADARREVDGGDAVGVNPSDELLLSPDGGKILPIGRLIAPEDSAARPRRFVADLVTLTLPDGPVDVAFRARPYNQLEVQIFNMKLPTPPQRYLNFLSLCKSIRT